MASDDGEFLAPSEVGDSQDASLAEGNVGAGGVGNADEIERADRAARRKRYVRLFCFSCNRYEGHSVASRSRILYSFLVGFTFGLYYFLGRYACHCCGSVRLGRRDWLNPRFWYRTMWLGGMARSKKAKTKSRSRRKG